MTDPAATAPVSPHLQIWRWTITMFVSIGHRVTGMALVAGTILLTIWLAAAATGDEAFATVSGIYTSPFGLLVLFAYTWALFFHLLNGVRHLIWDAGYGFEIASATRSGMTVVAAAAVLTLATWALGYAMMGA